MASNVTQSVVVTPANKKTFVEELTAAVASLKVTVTLFGLGLFLILVGTLAQDKIGVFEATTSYFRSFFVWVPFNVFFPKAWFPDMQWVQGGFWFFGGRTLGVALCANLLAAHFTAFSLKGRGRDLINGSLLFGLGVVISAAIILHASWKSGIQDKPLFDWVYIWYLVQLGTFVLGAYCVYLACFRTEVVMLVRGLAILGAAILFVTMGFVLFTGTSLQTAALRILWQLIQGTLGASVVLSGCYFLFQKRAGIVVIHLGIGLMMFNELFVSITNVEEQTTMAEGEEMNYARDIRFTELAIIDQNDPKLDKSTLVPQDQLRGGNVVKVEGLPFQVRIDRYYPNAEFMQRLSDNQSAPKKEGDETHGGEELLATFGPGKRFFAVERPTAGGAGQQFQDVPACYVTFLDPKDGKPIETLLLFLEDMMPMWKTRVSLLNKEYTVSLRFKRSYKPYSIQLIDTGRENYVGTQVPKTYWSTFLIHKPDADAPVRAKISMNEPLRYDGETFYQSGHTETQNGEVSTLQIVKNEGWMIPYIGCMFTVVGMLAHFSGMLGQFLVKLQVSGTTATEIREKLKASSQLSPEPLNVLKDKPAPKVKSEVQDERKWLRWVSISVGLAVGLIVVMYSARSNKSIVAPYRLDTVAKFPVTSDGRIAPFDTMARNTLRVLQKREQAKDQNPDAKKKEAIQWYLDVITEREGVDKMPVFKIEDLNLLSEMKLERSKGFVYSYEQVKPHRERIFEVASAATERQQSERTTLTKLEQASIDLRRKISDYETTRAIFAFPQATPEGLPKDFKREINTEIEFLNGLMLAARVTGKGVAVPLPIPVPASDRKFETFLGLEMRNQSIPFFKKMAEKLKVEKLTRDLLIEELDLLLAKQADSQSIMIFADAVSSEIRKQHPDWSTKEITEEIRKQISEGRIDLGLKARIDDELKKEVAQQMRVIRAAMDNVFPEAELPTEVNQEAKVFGDLLVAYKKQDPTEFNRAAEEYSKLAQAAKPQDYSMSRVLLEEWLGRFAPDYTAVILYLAGLLFAFIGLLVGFRFNQRTALTIVLFAFAVHGLGMLCRIYISGRPPVTNLFGASVLIGWGGVLFFLIAERVTKIGISTILGAGFGAVSLLVAYAISISGDRMAVMQAVLDTQFWLSTHVICITLGNCTTFVAGGLGAAYILARIHNDYLEPTRDIKRELRSLYGMMYGVTCFSIFFSFFGTVLGGLWADDSWGRFWGWDPKENGALMIVVWNAIALHARWGAIVRERGFAIISVWGGIITAWSLFGTNELGFGMHAYGQTEGVLFWMGIFMLSSLIMGLVGYVVRKHDRPNLAA